MPNLNISYNSVVVCPIMINYKGTMTDVRALPLPIGFLAKYDEAGKKTGEFASFNEIAELTNASYPVSKDGNYVALFVELSDLHNEQAGLKKLITDSGVVLGGTDFTRNEPNLAWYLTIKEWLEFSSISHLFKEDLVE